MDRTAHHGDVENESNNGSHRSISPTTGVVPLECLERRIGLLELAIVRVLTTSDPPEGRSVSALRDDHFDGRSIGQLLEAVAGQLTRIADYVDPPPPDLVGSTYIAERLGCTTVWVTEMVRSGNIPPNCVVQGTGNGKPWKFFRVRIDEWLKRR